MDMIQVQYTGKSEDAVPVFIITKEGKGYNQSGIDYIKEIMEEQFHIENDMKIYSGIALNDAETFAKLLETHMNGYVILSSDKGVGFIPNHNNQTLCENLHYNPDATSWEILMSTCRLME